MIKSIIKLGLFLVVGILCYNYFLGTEEEKASSKKIFTEIKDVGKSVGGLIKAEKSKFDDGKYDNALDKIGNVFKNIREKAKNSGDLMDRLEKLEEKKDELKDKLKEATEDGSEASEEQATDLKKELERLIKETEELAGDVEE